MGDELIVLSVWTEALFQERFNNFFQQLLSSHIIQNLRLSKQRQILIFFITKWKKQQNNHNTK